MCGDAAYHHLAKGVSAGVDYSVVRRMHNASCKAGNFDEAGLTVSIATAGLWTNAMLHNNEHSTSPVCPLCMRDGTELHRCYF